MQATYAPADARPWKAGLAWLAFLGPFFFASYGLANWAATLRDDVPTLAFGWERAIAFLPWTIVPYWFIDLCYAASLLLCTTRIELRTHVRRLVFVQVVAVTCFLVVPLRFGFERPAVDGILGSMFAALESFDRPYNQAPSLHIALLAVLWPVYLRAVPRPWHGLVHGLALLIGVSAMTTWQHHFIDVPTGAALGALAVWLIREDDADARWRWRRCADPGRRRLAAYYALGASACVAIAGLGGGALWFLWPAASLSLVALVYVFASGHAYAKPPDGRLPAASWLLFAPYLAGARVNAWLWTRADPRTHEVVPGVYLGSIVRPWSEATNPEASIVDLCAELSAPKTAAGLRVVPMLDLVVPEPDEMQAAVLAIDAATRRGPVLVACALGVSRSAAAVTAWMVYAGKAPSIEAAVAVIRAVRPSVVLSERHLNALHGWQHRAASERALA